VRRERGGLVVRVASDQPVLQPLLRRLAASTDADETEELLEWLMEAREAS